MTNRPIALVTGATRGIGRAICAELGSTHHVIVGGRDQLAVDAVVAALPDASGFVADLRDADAVAALTTQIESLDVLVHSAGILLGGRVADTAPEQWREIFDVNVVAVAELTRQLLVPLRAAGGTVVTINSGSGFHSNPGGGPYAASKFALRAFTDALREEERGTIRVSSIHPGRVDTDMQVALKNSEGAPYIVSELLTPQSVAKAVRFAVDAADEAMMEEISIRPIGPARS